MTSFAIDPEVLKTHIAQALGASAKRIGVSRGEVTVVVDSVDYLSAAKTLRDALGCRFETLVDLCGVDYSEYKDMGEGE